MASTKCQPHSRHFSMLQIFVRGLRVRRRLNMYIVYTKSKPKSFFCYNFKLLINFHQIRHIAETSCARGDTICLHPLHVDNIFAFIRQVAPVTAFWLFKTSATTFSRLPFDLETCVRVTCDAGYLCANFSLPRPLCSLVRPGVPDRQTSDRRQTCLRPMGAEA